MKVYLDDLRTAPEGWVRCYWPNEVIALLENGGVTHLSLDHDLGDAKNAIAENRPEITGYDVVIWLEEQVMLGTGKVPTIPRIRLHTSNPEGYKRMLASIQAMERKLGTSIHIL